MAIAGAALAATPLAPLSSLAQTLPDPSEISYKHQTLASSSTAPVGIQLVLAMDTSGSMSNEEFEIEKQATAYALNSQMFRSVIKYKGGNKSVAVAVVDFDFNAQVRIKWVDIRGEEINDKPYQPNEQESSAAPDKLDMLAEEIRNIPRRSSGGTAIESAMDLSRLLYLGCPWQATERRVLDVFGDGSSSVYAMNPVREQLASMGVTINGFAIVNDEPTLEEFFSQNLVTRQYTAGPDGIYSEPGRVWAVARNLQATGNQAPGLKSFFGEVARGMKQKISVEVAGLDNYQRTLALLGEQPGFVMPQPVTVSFNPG